MVSAWVNWLKTVLSFLFRGRHSGTDDPLNTLSPRQTRRLLYFLCAISSFSRMKKTKNQERNPKITFHWKTFKTPAFVEALPPPSPTPYIKPPNTKKKAPQLLNRIVWPRGKDSIKMTTASKNDHWFFLLHNDNTHVSHSRDINIKILKIIQVKSQA